MVSSATATFDYAAGDLPEDAKARIVTGDCCMEGNWEEVKAVSDKQGDFLGDLGVGFMKRKAANMAQLKLAIQREGTGVFKYTTFFPLGITKEQTFPTDGSQVVLPDRETCDWKAVACQVQNNCVVQRRESEKGVWYDLRAVLTGHPSGKTDVSPLLVMQWTFVPVKGESRRITQYFAKKQ